MESAIIQKKKLIQDLMPSPEIRGSTNNAKNDPELRIPTLNPKDINGKIISSLYQNINQKSKEKKISNLYETRFKEFEKNRLMKQELLYLQQDLVELQVKQREKDEIYKSQLIIYLFFTNYNTIFRFYTRTKNFSKFGTIFLFSFMSTTKLLYVIL